MRIYGDIGSGNCQKVKATADFLGLAYDWDHDATLRSNVEPPSEPPYLHTCGSHVRRRDCIYEATWLRLWLSPPNRRKLHPIIFFR